jgi:hypothetical protein
MQELLNIVTNLVKTYGYWVAIDIGVVAVATELIKIPLKSKIEAWAVSTHNDKAALTCWLMFLPMAVALVVNFVFYAWRTCQWHFASWDIKEYSASTVTVYGASVALYESVSVWAKKVLSGQKKAIAAATGSKEVDALTLTQIRAAYKAVKAESKAKAKQAKAEAKAKSEAEAKAKEAQAKAQAYQAKKAELEKELAELNATPAPSASGNTSVSNCNVKIV